MKYYVAGLNFSDFFFFFYFRLGVSLWWMVDHIFDIKQKQYHECSAFLSQCDFSLVFSRLWETWHTNKWQLSNYSKVAGNWFLSETDRDDNLCEMWIKPHVGDAEVCCFEQLVCHQNYVAESNLCEFLCAPKNILLLWGCSFIHRTWTFCIMYVYRITP